MVQAIMQYNEASNNQHKNSTFTFAASVLYEADDLDVNPESRKGQ